MKNPKMANQLTGLKMYNISLYGDTNSVNYLRTDEQFLCCCLLVKKTFSVHLSKFVSLSEEFLPCSDTKTSKWRKYF